MSAPIMLINIITSVGVANMAKNQEHQKGFGIAREKDFQSKDQ